MNKPLTPAVIIGCGYIGSLLADQLTARGQQVSALVRSQATYNHLVSRLDTVQAADLDDPLQLALSTGGSQLFYFSPPPSMGSTDSRTTHLLQALSKPGKQPDRIVYISTTGVYGDCQGRWIDESAPTNAQVDRAKRRMDAETQLSAFGKSLGSEIIIVRVAGIYGPGKLPLKRIAAGDPVVKADQSPYTNRIHAHDLVKMLDAAMQRGVNGAIYHGCDGSPGKMADYFKAVALKAGLAPPPEITLQEAQKKLSPGMLSYMSESRRLKNQVTLEALDLTLDYPNLHAGLEHCGL